MHGQPVDICATLPTAVDKTLVLSTAGGASGKQLERWQCITPLLTAINFGVLGLLCKLLRL